ncbi:MAG: hypothetical protein WDZ52_07410 [Pseudohongiellaceae bacterium]
MHGKNLTQVLRLTAEMENRAADGEWGIVQELDAARMLELEKLHIESESGAEDTSKVFSWLLQSNRSISSMARKAQSNLRLERQQLLRGKKATGSYQQVQGTI